MLVRFGIRLANKIIQLHWYYVQDNPNEGDNSTVMYGVFSYVILVMWLFPYLYTCNKAIKCR